MAGALAAQPAPAPATADGIDTIAAEIRAGLREHTDLMMEDAVGIRFSLKAASAGGLDATRWAVLAQPGNALADEEGDDSEDKNKEGKE
mgnify:CR=1 FL=1